MRCAKYWKEHYFVTLTIYLLLKLLCFSDSENPGKHEFYYHLQQTIFFFFRRKDALEDATLFSQLFVDKALDKDAVFSDSESDNKRIERVGGRRGKKEEEKEEKSEEDCNEESTSINNDNETLTVANGGQGS